MGILGLLGLIFPHQSGLTGFFKGNWMRSGQFRILPAKMAFHVVNPYNKINQSSSLRQFIINPYPECFGHFQGGIPLRNYLFGVFPTGGFGRYNRSYTLSICAIYMFVMTLCYISKGVGIVFNSDHSQMGYKNGHPTFNKEIILMRAYKSLLLGWWPSPTIGKPFEFRP